MRQLFREWLEIREERFLLLERIEFSPELVASAQDDEDEVAKAELMEKSLEVTKRILRSKGVSNYSDLDDISQMVMTAMLVALDKKKIIPEKYESFLNSTITRSQLKHYQTGEKELAGAEPGFTEPGTGGEDDIEVLRVRRGGAKRSGATPSSQLRPSSIFSDDPSARARRARIQRLQDAIEQLATGTPENPPKPSETRAANVLKLSILPDPDDPERTYSTKNIGKELGLSAQQVANSKQLGAKYLKKLMSVDEQYLVEYFFPS